MMVDELLGPTTYSTQPAPPHQAGPPKLSQLYLRYYRAYILHHLPGLTKIDAEVGPLGHRSSQVSVTPPFAGHCTSSYSSA